ncbi:dihydrofolate reductase [Kosakonia phage Kc263]|uniref:dihydrofolate reductase n=1 Tax=Kosakonia phage Kc263 TaxID=2863194 RepID=A0AAE7WFG6_9CAUD|nr:dihydrofolate reductase [Kosakonia phage Kc263]QYN80144.1 dihydrofolate reductase [Kosakonia phage Kc263]
MNNFFTKIHSFVSPLSYSMIMAVDDRGGMGLRNSLPWKEVGVDNKSDMQWFREKTKGKIIIMGYNTWVSIGRKPLPGRYNVIVTKEHHKEVQDDFAKWADSYYKTEKGQREPIHGTVTTGLEDAIKYLETTIGHHHRGGEVMVIGGAKMYESMMPRTSRIYLTTFKGEFEADAFVHLNLDKWDLVYRDALSCLQPKFEIWDGTEEAAKLPDSEFIQISHGHKPAVGWVAETVRSLKEDK